MKISEGYKVNFYSSLAVLLLVAIGSFILSMHFPWFALVPIGIFFWDYFIRDSRITAYLVWEIIWIIVSGAGVLTGLIF